MFVIIFEQFLDTQSNILVFQDQIQLEPYHRYNQEVPVLVESAQNTCPTKSFFMKNRASQTEISVLFES